jgi:GTP cyclohydrolase IA
VIRKDLSNLTIQEMVAEIISRYDDPHREGLKNTPERVAKAFDSLFSGYGYSEQQIANMLTVFAEDKSDDMVVQRYIPFTSTCEHHLLPFMGLATIAYIPNGKIVGLSKLSRLLDVFCKRMQNQERITVEVVEAMMRHLNPKGAACVLQATHSCMECRGISKAGIETTTCCLKGCFGSDPTRSEFLRFATSKG